MSPIIRVIAPIFGNQVKRIHLNYNNFLGNSFVRFKSDQQSGKTKTIKGVKNPWANLTEEEWRERLTYEEFEVTRKKATEFPFSGKYYNHNEEGIYQCTCCSETLFCSKEKYDSGSGWPSFYSTVAKPDGDKSNRVKLKTDTSYGMLRTEVLCGKCDAHLGHLFNDGPPPTGLRYCVNSISLKFLSMKDDKKN